MTLRSLATATLTVLALGVTGDLAAGIAAGGAWSPRAAAQADHRSGPAQSTAQSTTQPTAQSTGAEDRRGLDLHTALASVGDGPVPHDHSSHDHGPDADDLAPFHADPPPPGVDLSAPTDTRSLYRRAGLPRPRAGESADADGTAQSQGQAQAGTVPPGTPVVPGLSEHVEPSCTGTGSDGKRVQVIYAHEPSTTSRYAAVLDLMRHEIATVDDIFAVSSAKTGGGRRVRWVHDVDCVPVIDAVQLPAGSLGSSFSATINALKAAGYTRADRKYVVFADANALCGIASYYEDARPTGNYNNGAAATYSRIDAGCWTTRSVSTVAHELLHNLGGVLGTAPNATTNGHCSDEWDVMCYDDGSGIPMRSVCASDHKTLLDCREDDYFSTAPAPGSFLAGSWNTASSGFLDVVPALGTTPPPPPPPPAPAPTPQVAVVASAGSAQTGDTVTFTASVAEPAAFTWSFTHTDCVVGPTGTATLTVRCPSTRTGTLTATVTATGAWGSSQASSPLTMSRAAAPTVTVAGPGSVATGTAFTLTATPTGKAPFGYLWQTGQGCTLQSSTAATATAVCDDTAGGSSPSFAVTVTQADGQTGSATRLVPVQSTAAPVVTSLRAWVRQARTTSVRAALTQSQGAALAGERVVLKRRDRGSARWVRVVVLTTNSRGVVRLRVPARRVASYRWVHRATDTTTRSVSNRVVVRR